MLIYLHTIENGFCYTALYFLYKNNAQILCKTLVLLKLLMSARGMRSCCGGDYTGVPTVCLGHLRYSGQCWWEATVLLAPSLHNSAAIQQEFISLLFCECIYKQIQGYSAECPLCTFLLVLGGFSSSLSFIGILIMASFSNTH